MERRLGIMQSVEPVLENAIKTLQKVVDVRGMGKKWAPWGLEHLPWTMTSNELNDVSIWEEKMSMCKLFCEPIHIDASSGAASQCHYARSQSSKYLRIF